VSLWAYLILILPIRGVYDNPVARFAPLVFSVCFILGNIVPDYLSLWKTTYLLNISRKMNSVFLTFTLLGVDVAATVPIAFCAQAIGVLFISVYERNMGRLPHVSSVQGARLIRLELYSPTMINPLVLPAMVFLFFVSFVPALFGRLWLLAYVGSALLLKTARRLDLGFAWFNKRFDVENHPLQCIGLVAEALCAFGYWILAAIHLVP
jgi:hypothetical protein